MGPLRLLFVVQRYGPEVRGGAEQATRAVAERLTERGHRVEVLTTTATSYVDWSGHLPAGTSEERGVLVHRLPVSPLRDPQVFDRLHHRMWNARPPVDPELQRRWMEAQGPSVPLLEGWLDDHAAGFDVAVFFTYLYGTTTAGLPVAARRTATALVPCAHDEPPLALAAFDRAAHLADSLLYLTPEEAALFTRRFRLRAPHHVVGLGAEMRGTTEKAVSAFRATSGLEGDPYLLYVGRIDPSKGTSWLAESFARYKDARPSRTRLVLLGEPVDPPDRHRDLIVVPGADDAERDAAMAGAIALVHPSPFESFAMVVTEAWSVGAPVVAFGGNEVLRGHVERSGGGLLFETAAELGAAAELLASDPGARDALGAAGRRHVESQLTWPLVIERWERALQRTAAAGRGRPAPPPAPAPPSQGPLTTAPGPESTAVERAAAAAPEEVPTRQDLPPAWLARPLVGALSILVAAAVVGVLAAMAGAFQPEVVLPLAGVTGLPMAWLSARALPRWRSPRSAHLVAGAVLLAAAASTAYNMANHGEHIVADRDPGVYLTTAKNLLDDGDLLVPGPTGPFDDADGVSDNGVGFSPERRDGTLEPQFPHLTSVLLAGAGWVDELGMFLLNPALGGFALVCLYAWSTALVGPRWSLVAVLVTAASMPFVVFARDAFSEPLAMALAFGGFWALHVAATSRRRMPWLVAGLVIGASAMARVDGFLYLAPAAAGLVLAGRLAPERRRTWQGIALCSVGIATTATIGWWDTATFTGGYFDESLRPRLPGMLGAAGAAAVASWVLVPLLWRRSGSGQDPRPTLELRLVAPAVGAGLLAAAAWAWWVRPDAGSAPEVAVEGINVLSYLPVVKTLSLHWLSWYLSPLGLAAGVLGLVLIVAAMGWRPAPPPAVATGLLTILVTLILYLWTPSITPDQPWAMRRFAPVALPGLAVAVAALCRGLWWLGSRRRSPSSSVRGHLATAIVASAASLGLAGAVVGATAAITWPVREVRAQVPMRQRIQEVCAQVEPDDALLVPIDGILALMMSVPAGVWCDVPSAGGTTELGPDDVARLAVDWEAEGRRLVVLSSSATPLMNTLLPTGIVAERILTEPVFPVAVEPTITSRPRRVVVDGRLGKGPQGEVTFQLYPIDVDAARRYLETGDPVSSAP